MTLQSACSNHTINTYSYTDEAEEEPNDAKRLNDVLKRITDGQGRITSGKLRGFVTQHGLNFTEQEIQEMLQEVDGGGRGDVSYKGKICLIGLIAVQHPSIYIGCNLSHCQIELCLSSHCHRK